MLAVSTWGRNDKRCVNMTLWGTGSPSAAVLPLMEDDLHQDWATQGDGVRAHSLHVVIFTKFGESSTTTTRSSAVGRAQHVR